MCFYARVEGQSCLQIYWHSKKNKIIPPATMSALSLKQFESCPCRWVHWYHHTLITHYAVVWPIFITVLNALFQKSKDYRFRDAATLGEVHQTLPVLRDTHHTHFAHPLFNLLQKGLVKRPQAVSFSFPLGTILWRADRYWWLLRQTSCQALNTQSLKYNLLPTVTSPATLHSSIVTHFYTFALGKSVF